MKTKTMNGLAIGLAGLLSVGVFDAPARLEVGASFQINAVADFHVPLAAHGVWVEVGSYGRCWRPAAVAVGWRPYTYGHWVWTDCGWYWVSDEPWAWACYHYGSWHHDSIHGWVWVPGTVWAPAWVEWRFGGGYVGWAPCAPHGFLAVGITMPWVFVEVHRFHEPIRPGKFIVNNTTIINKTKVFPRSREETRTIGGAGPQRVMFNEGPGREVIEKASGKQARVLAVNDAVRETRVPAEVERRGRNPQSGASEQPKPGPKQKSAPDEKVEPPPRQKPSDSDVAPQPARPPGGPSDKGEPPEKPAKPPGGKGKGKSQGPSGEKGGGKGKS
jgi:hypothetical protein